MRRQRRRGAGAFVNRLPLILNFPFGVVLFAAGGGGLVGGREGGREVGGCMVVVVEGRGTDGDGAEKHQPKKQETDGLKKNIFRICGSTICGAARMAAY